MPSEGALLALVVDDDVAMVVLAAWAALGPSIAMLEDEATQRDLARLANVSLELVPTTLARLRAARTLIDGGITDLADRMLQTRVQSRLTGGKRKA